MSDLCNAVQLEETFVCNSEEVYVQLSIVWHQRSYAESTEIPGTLYRIPQSVEVALIIDEKREFILDGDVKAYVSPEAALTLIAMFANSDGNNLWDIVNFCDSRFTKYGEG